jgi:hypothetical protein
MGKNIQYMKNNKNTPKKVILVCGARPNFMKIAPAVKETKSYSANLKPLGVIDR